MSSKIKSSFFLLFKIKSRNSSVVQGVTLLKLVFRKLETRLLVWRLVFLVYIPFTKEVAGGSDLCHDSGLGKNVYT